jgi:hypothetical protein
MGWASQLLISERPTQREIYHLLLGAIILTSKFETTALARMELANLFGS